MNTMAKKENIITTYLRIFKLRENYNFTSIKLKIK